MADRTQSLSLHETNSENNQSNTSTIKSNQILSNSTNIHSKNCQTSVGNNISIQSVRRRRHVSSTLATVRRYKEVIKHKNQLDTIPNEIENLKDFQQRRMYNARQTPLISLITDVDLSVIVKSSQQQDNLLMDILTLINNIDEECSFFQQFNI